MSPSAARPRAATAMPPGAVALVVAFLLGIAVAPPLQDAIGLLTGRTPEAVPSATVVMPDSGVAVSSLVELVRASAADIPGTRPEVDIEIVFTDRLEGDGSTFLAGTQQGSEVIVRLEGVAAPTRTLVHELAHAVTPGTGHGEAFRTVYLAAIADVYDDATAQREGRRLAWVYDRCYLDDTCPLVKRNG